MLPIKLPTKYPCVVMLPVAFTCDPESILPAENIEPPLILPPVILAVEEMVFEPNAASSVVTFELVYDAGSPVS